MGGSKAHTKKRPAETKPKAPADKTWHDILEQAARSEANYIHLEPTTDGLLIRYRRHGLLSDASRLSAQTAQALIAYLKERAQLDKRQTSSPQSGDFADEGQYHMYKLSLATIPLLGGERLVIHLHDPHATPPSLEALGFWGKGLQEVQQALTQPHGLVLICGPNRSGTAITLASFAASMVHPVHQMHPVHQIASVETDIAYRVPNVVYMQVRPDIGMTWQRVLHLQLQHEPTAVVLGSIPDRATAETALTAAEHRQLVLASMAVDTMVSGLSRASQLSGDPLGVVAALRLITNQRLVWHLCTYCREAYAPTAAELEPLRIRWHLDRPTAMQRLHKLELEAIASKLSGGTDTDPSTTERGIVRLWRPAKAGCQHCHGSGYSGAVALCSVLVPTDHVRSLIAKRAPIAELQTAVSEDSSINLQVDGLVKALRGLISIDAVLAL
jgi:type II secretory ATPase GspE/PulE/Tfp pilus assembly ATPase PilB-like protein